MNIFKMLSTGDGRIHEPSFSAFLCYLLDPGADHGLHSAFLELFLEPIIKKNKEIFKDLTITDAGEKLKNLSVYSPEFIIETFPEVKLPVDEGSADIDIIIEISRKKNKDGDAELKYVFGIENKTKDFNNEDVKKQLEKEIRGLKAEYGDDIQIGFIFLEKDNSSGIEIPSAQNLRTKRLFWKKMSGENSPNSIYCMLSEVLRKEVSGEIEPIYEYTKHTIKALINFIDSDFKSYAKEKEESGRHTGEFSALNREGLLKAGTYEFVKSLRKEFDELGFKTSNCTIPGHISEATGYLGFMVNMDGIEFSISVTKSNKPKVLVTRFEQGIPERLGLKLDDGQKDREYYNILEFNGQKFNGQQEKDNVIAFFRSLVGKL